MTNSIESANNHRLISMMINAPHFAYWNVFIIKDGPCFKLYGESIPGKIKPLSQGKYSTLTGAKRAADKITVPKTVLKGSGDRPIWGPLFQPCEEWFAERIKG